MRNIQLFDQDLGVHSPGEIGGADAIVDDRPGNSKARSADAFRCQVRSSLAREFLYDEIELRKFLAGEPLLEDGCELAVFFRKERKIALRTTNIPRKNHLSP